MTDDHRADLEAQTALHAVGLIARGLDLLAQLNVDEAQEILKTVQPLLAAVARTGESDDPVEARRERESHLDNLTAIAAEHGGSMALEEVPGTDGEHWVPVVSQLRLSATNAGTTTAMLGVGERTILFPDWAAVLRGEASSALEELPGGEAFAQTDCLLMLDGDAGTEPHTTLVVGTGRIVFPEWAQLLERAFTVSDD